LATDPIVLAALEELVDDALVQRIFDPQLNDYVFSILPITRAFVAGQVARAPDVVNGIRGRLTSFFEATDIPDAETRLVVREARQGRASPETSLLDLAISAETRGDYRTAADLYSQALSRNPKSWQVARRFAEFQRHKERNMAEALRLYEQAAAHAPRRGGDRALIFREWGMLLRNSGSVDATSRAIECFEMALAETPNDSLAIHALATMLLRSGQTRRVIDLLEPLLTHASRKTQEMAADTLLQAYKSSGDVVKATQLRDRLGR
jgi:tetratricopeptide (TPR) repeat protein